MIVPHVTPWPLLDIAIVTSVIAVCGGCFWAIGCNVGSWISRRFSKP